MVRVKYQIPKGLLAGEKIGLIFPLLLFKQIRSIKSADIFALFCVGWVGLGLDNEKGGGRGELPPSKEAGRDPELLR